MTLRYEAGGPRAEATGTPRSRLVDAHRLAAEFFVAQLDSPEAQTGRDFLKERGFGKDAAGHFGVGYAPQGWSALLDHLRARNFTEAELKSTGMFSEGNRGLYDRFRGRLVWPIRDVTGDVIGFGARKLYEDDQGPKYLNTPETSLYKKGTVLYGIDLAKGAIRTERTAVVVEGYTDVMACHLAGVPNAVATCGTAFGEDHVKVIRRLMGDTGSAQVKVGSTGAKVIFTFDGDEAGQNAALKSFALDQQFLAQTFVAVDPSGQDPCELRQHGGDAAVRSLLESRVPLYEFVIKTTLAGHDLDTPEGRVAALRAAAPVVARLRDTALRPEYARRLAGWLGMETDVVIAAVTHTGGGRAGGGATSAQRPQGADPADGGPVVERPDRRDPVVRAEALSLGVLLQAPEAIRKDKAALAVADELPADAFGVGLYRAIFSAVQAAGGVRAAGPDWVARVAEEAGEDLAGSVNELAVTPLPHDRPETIGTYAGSVMGKVFDGHLTKRIGELRGAMKRAGEGTDDASRIFGEIIALETKRRALRAD